MEQSQWRHRNGMENTMSCRNFCGLSTTTMAALALASLTVGCSQSNGGGGGSGGSGSGGTVAVSSGGASGSGGVATTGGTTGTGGAGTGGAASGGTKGEGGASSGGASGTGGAGSGGATTAKGGSTGSGGSAGTGGARDAGSTSAAGGAGPADGSVGAGGDTGMGGSTGTGGGTAMGGTTGAGGASSCPDLAPAPTGTTDAVSGKLIQFNDNGGWCWYQDERAVVDTKGGKLVIGSVASGGSRTGNIEAVVYNLSTGSKVGPTKLGNLSIDDHNAPGIVIRPDGKYVAMYCGHRIDCITRWSIFDGTSWSSEKTFNWNSAGCPWAGASTNMVTYSNPWYMGSDIYSAVRSVGTDPAILTSTDDGSSWSYYGRLMSTKQTGYVAGYFKYWGNNTDRIDFVGTEAHPRDFDTSLYHGYIQDGKVYDSMGTVKDNSLKDTNASTTTSVDINTYTPVFKTGSTIGGVKLEHAWNHDIVRYADGTVAILGQARVTGTGTDDPDKRFLYFRFDGKSWKSTYLVRGGSKLYSSEQDYTGLSALDPDNPNIIYVSSTYDPRDDKTKTSKHEIYQGVTCDNGATWKWTPITQGSTMDNVRPIVPKWDSSHTALLWMRGSYTSAQSFSMQIVGTITGQ
jgi:hypothetical protein